MNDPANPDRPFTSFPLDGGFSESGAPDITVWKLARCAIEHENNLINHRLTWFFSAQAFLLTVFFVVVTYADKSFFKQLESIHILPILLLTIGFLAIYMCLVTQNGMDRAYTAMDDVTEYYEQIVKQHGFSRTPPLHFWRKPTMFNQRHIPTVTIVLWIVLVSVCAVARLPAVQAVTVEITMGQAMIASSILLVFFGGIGVGFLLSSGRKHSSRKCNLSDTIS